MTQDSHLLFISHSSYDAEPTEFLQARLLDAGYRCWVDAEAIAGSAAWLHEIEAGIEACAALIVIMTPAARASVWVDREILYAFQRKKPVFVALFEDVIIPIVLIDLQQTDFRRRREAGMKKLLASLDKVLSRPKPMPPPGAARHEARFLKYLEQLPGGTENARIARELLAWAHKRADAVTFSGRDRPAFHVHVYAGAGGVIVCSLRAFPKQPALEVPLRYWKEWPPYDNRGERTALLATLNTLQPPHVSLSAARADLHPTVPLVPGLASPEGMARLLALLETVIEQLREVSSGG